MPLNGTNPKPLVFKEIYYTGSRTPGNGTYFSDQFYEIYNNSDEVIYADSLCIANTGGASGQTATGRTWGFRPDQQFVYLQNVWMIPGNGHQHPIQPGESIVIAQDGIDHQNDPLGKSFITCEPWTRTMHNGKVMYHAPITATSMQMYPTCRLFISDRLGSIGSRLCSARQW